MKPYKIGGTLADNVLKYGTGAYNETILLNYNQTTDNIWHIQSSSNDSGLHPTQKPLKLMKMLIEMTTLPEQIVLDPFSGSGTTLVAAMKLKRHYIGFENNETYFTIAQERLEKEKKAMESMLF